MAGTRPVGISSDRYGDTTTAYVSTLITGSRVNASTYRKVYYELQKKLFGRVVSRARVKLLDRKRTKIVHGRSIYLDALHGTTIKTVFDFKAISGIDGDHGSISFGDMIISYLRSIDSEENIGISLSDRCRSAGYCLEVDLSLLGDLERVVSIDLLSTPHSTIFPAPILMAGLLMSLKGELDLSEL